MTFFTKQNKRLSGRLAPPTKAKSHMEFARTLLLPDGPQAGSRWDPRTERVQELFIRALSNNYRTYVVVAPSQRGKTLMAILYPWLYAVAEEGLSVGYVLPTGDKLQQNWEGKLKPAIQGSGYGSWLPVKGPGSKGGKSPAITMMSPSGHKKTVTYFMSAGAGGKETSISSVSPARIVVDEADDFASVGQIELALRRLESWGAKGKAFIASTVNSRINRDEHPVLSLFNRSDATQTRVAHKCPHCQAYQIIAPEQFNIDIAAIACVKCGAIWSENDRHKALNDAEFVSQGQSIHDGVIVGEAKNTTFFSLLTTGFDFNMADFGLLASTWKAAKEKEALGDYSMAEMFAQKVLCQPYDIPADHDTITDKMLSLRSAASHYGRGMVPPECDRIVVGVDVQKDRIYWVAIAQGSHDRRYIIDWNEWGFATLDEHGKKKEPTESDFHGALTKLLTKCREGWYREGQAPLQASLIGVDIGYNPDGIVGRWIRGRQGVVACRGDSNTRVEARTIEGKLVSKVLTAKQGSTLEADSTYFEIRKQEISPDQPLFWYFCKTTALREHVAGRFRRPVHEEGSLMLPKDIYERDDLIKHLTAWAIMMDPKTKSATWTQIRARDDYNDALCYGHALLSMQKNPKQTAGKIVA